MARFDVHTRNTVGDLFNVRADTERRDNQRINDCPDVRVDPSASERCQNVIQ